MNQFDIFKDLQSMENNNFQKIGRIFVLEVLHHFKEINLLENTSFSFFPNDTLDCLFLYINGETEKYSQNSYIPYAHLKNIFFGNSYSTYYTHEGIVSFINHFTKNNSKEIIQIAEQEGLIPLQSILAKQKIEKMTPSDKLIEKIFNVDNISNTFYFNKDAAKKLVNRVLNNEFNFQDVTLGNSKNSYSWLFDLAGCAFIRDLKGTDTEGYANPTLFENHGKYLHLAGYVFNLLPNSTKILLTDFEDAHIPSCFNQYQKKDLLFPHGNLLDIFMKDVIRGYGFYKEEFNEVFQNIFSKVDIPIEKAVNSVKEIFSSDTVEYFGYGSEKGDEYLKNALQIVFKDFEKSKDLIEKHSLQFNMERVNEILIDNIKKNLPNSFKFLQDLGLLAQKKNPRHKI